MNSSLLIAFANATTTAVLPELPRLLGLADKDAPDANKVNFDTIPSSTDIRDGNLPGKGVYTLYPRQGYGHYGNPGDYEGMDGREVPIENLAESIIIIILGIAIIISNIFVLSTFITMPGPRDVIVYYLMSLGVADLVGGVIVVPLSVYPAMKNSWVYGNALCGLAGYIEITIWFAQLYTFMWISVDRYLAIRKPLRYETVQTKTRCQCWVVFTWLTSMMLCCPPLLGFNKSSHYDADTFVCWLDWNSMLAYGFTLIPMVLGPTLITIVYTYAYIFYTMRRLKQCVVGQDKEFITALTENLSNPDHAMSFVLVLLFWISWSPCVVMKTYEYLTDSRVAVEHLHFFAFWFGVLNSFWKSVIYLAMSPKFRTGLKLFCLSLCCQRRRHEQEAMYEY